ncbi:MAG: hypothetical protein K2G88_08335, partial [Oscillospiraceae bacterium]|nr:hypothetical protein [Oscillospiraceae bacterium]
YKCYAKSEIDKNIIGSYVSDTLRKVTLLFETGDTIPAYSDCIRFKIQQHDISGVLGTEYDLHCSISKNDTKPSIDIETNENGISFTKCIYSMGDVDRNGIVDENDASLVMKAVVGLMIDNPSSPSIEYDKLAFTLAGDVAKEDGVITIADSVAMNQYLKVQHF